MRMLQLIWSQATDAQKITWKPSSESSLREAYLAFLTQNLLEFRTYHSPVLDRPRNSTALSWTTSVHTITPKVHGLELFHHHTFGSLKKCHLVYRREGAIPDEVQEEFVFGTFSQLDGDFLYLDIVPTLNTYGYRIARYTANGQKSPTLTYNPTAPLDQ